MHSSGQRRIGPCSSDSSADWSSLAERVVTATPAQRLAAFRLACEALLIPPAEDDADAGADAEPASKRQKRADAESERGARNARGARV